jgi:DNA-binding MarR family transcriptional regulator
MPTFLDLHGKTTKVLRTLAERAMQRYGLRDGQNHLLAVLWQRDGATPGEIATWLHVTTPTVVKMATRMTRAGLLTRRRDAKDHRLVRLWLTSVGRSLQQPIEAERQAIEAQVTAELTAAEREHVLRALAKIHRTASDVLAAQDAEPRPPRATAAAPGPATRTPRDRARRR